LYMALGGIPYYLRYVNPGLSAEENIQRIFFDKGSPLLDEYVKLFESLFESADAYRELVQLIAVKREGVSRSELTSTAQLSQQGGRLSQRLKDLCATGFIEEYIPWEQEVGEYYKVIDEYCLFYIYWVQDIKKFSGDHWITQSQRPAYYAWSGYAFEAICAKHVDQIISALNIRTSSTYGSWRYVPKKHAKESGAQIDLIIDRVDNAMNLCEIKYTDAPFAIDKQYAQKLKNKIDVFVNKTGINKQIFLTMVSANGLKKNTYSDDIVANTVDLSDLFKYEGR